MAAHTQKMATRVQTLGEYFFAATDRKIAEVAAAGMKIINLGVGSPDLPPSLRIILKLQEKSNDPTQHVYPSYIGLRALRDELAAWYQREYEILIDPLTMVQPVAGSKEGIVFTTLALVNKGEEVLYPNPGYSTYQRAAVISGAIPRPYVLTDKNGFLPNVEELEKSNLSNVKLMWINYPHNPTGAIASLEQLQKIVSFAKRHNILIASDNPYSHITFGFPRAVSILEVPDALEIAVELNSWSKTYNMAGWRLGWVAGNAELITAISALYSNVETGIFLPIQHAGIEALRLPRSWIEERNQVYIERMSVLKQIVTLLGATSFDSKASLYLWAKLPENARNSKDFCFSLLEKTGIFITPGIAFGDAGEGFMRLSVCQPLEVLNRAKIILEEYNKVKIK